MASKMIYCSGCKLYLGEIKLATLRKNISHLCENCENARYQNHKTEPKNPYNPNNPLGKDIEDMFGSIFGDTFK